MGWDPLMDISMVANGTDVEPVNAAESMPPPSMRSPRQPRKAGYRSDRSQPVQHPDGHPASTSSAWLKNNHEAVARFLKAAVKLCPGEDR